MLHDINYLRWSQGIEPLQKVDKLYKFWYNSYWRFKNKMGGKK